MTSLPSSLAGHIGPLGTPPHTPYPGPQVGTALPCGNHAAGPPAGPHAQEAHGAQKHPLWWGPGLTFTPKSGDMELQMAPMLAAASMASTACTLLGK